MRTKTIVKKSVYHCSCNHMMQLLRELESLQYIGWPWASFEPVEKSSKINWQQGELYRFKLRLLGFIPLGIHTINVICFDITNNHIFTNESNPLVPVWNHRITLNNLTDNTIEYMDEVEIGAGIFTGVVALWAKCFYGHRQRRWNHLLEKNGDNDD